MSFELGEAFVRVRPNMDRFEGEASTGIGGALSNVFSGSAVMGALDSLGGTINRTIMGAVTAAGAGVAAVLGLSLGGGVTRLLDTEDARKMFGQLGLSVQETDAHLADLDQTFLKGSFAYPDVYDVSSQLFASGTGMDDLNDRTLTAGNMAAFANVELSRVGEILSIITANGKVSAEELNRLGQMGIPIKSILAEALGVTQEELMEMVSSGELTTDMFFDAAEGAAQLDGAMEGMADTTRGAWTNFKTAFAGIGEALLAPWFGENGTMVTWLQSLGDYIYANMDAFSEWGQRIYDVAMNAIQNTILPALRTLGDFIQNTIVPALQTAGEWYRNNEEMIGRIAAAMGPAIGIVAGFASSIHLVRTAFQLLMAATPIGMILALVTALVYAYQNSETFRNIVNNAFTAVRDVVGPIIERVVGWVSGLGQSTSETGTWLAETWAQIQATFQSAIDAITAIVTFFVDFAMDIWDRFGEHILSAAQQIWEHIQQIIGGVLDVIQGIFEVFAGAFTGDWSRVWEGIKQIFSGVWEAIKGVFGSAVTIVKTVLGAFLATVSAMWSAAWNRIRSFFSSIWNRIKSIVTGVLSSIYTTVVSRFIAIRTAITNAINAARARVTAVFNAIRATITTVVNAVRTRVSSAFNTVRTLVTTAVNAVKTRVTAAFNAVRTAVMTRLLAVIKLVRGLPGRALAALGNIKTKLKSAGRKLIQGFVDGILAVARRPVEAVSGIISNVRNLLPFSPAKEGPLSGRGYPLYSGQAIGEDLASGLDRSRSSARHAAEKLMREVSGAMSTSTSRGLAVAGAAAGRGAGGGAGGGDTYNIEKVVIPARDIQEFKDVTDFFKEVRQVARKGGVG